MPRIVAFKDSVSPWKRASLFERVVENADGCCQLFDEAAASVFNCFELWFQRSPQKSEVVTASSSHSTLGLEMEPNVKSRLKSLKQGYSLCIWWIQILIALVVVSTYERIVVFSDAAFVPWDRSELQDSVFECVGSCDDVYTYDGFTYCRNPHGDWAKGTGSPCEYGYYGTMGSWDVSKVQNMRYSMCERLYFFACS